MDGTPMCTCYIELLFLTLPTSLVPTYPPTTDVPIINSDNVQSTVRNTECTGTRTSRNTRTSYIKVTL